MPSTRQLFLSNIAQTSDAPMAIEVASALGAEVTGTDGMKWIDLIAGISVSNVGHCHPDVVAAVQEQAASYMHVMVYGEMIQSPQVMMATELLSHLPENLNNCYFVNSGSEAIEGAMKLAKRFTRRHEIVAFKNGYHGSTQGALSIIGSPYFQSGFHPLLPGIKHIDYENYDELDLITNSTACVIAEVVRGEAGAVCPDQKYLAILSAHCKKNGVLLIIDEVQTGFMRTGSFMAFSDTEIIPDILVLAKGMGGGMPLGAFIASREIMSSFTNNPVLGHITTFGGHPVSCAAALAALRIVNGIKGTEVIEKGELFKKLLVHQRIKSISGKGLLLAVEFENEDINKRVISQCIKNGVITDWFLFAPEKMRIAPPLIITDLQIKEACNIILKSINEI